MRARLLDLGEVGPVRSQSAYHAVLGGIGRDDDAVLLIVRPSAPLVSIGELESEGLTAIESHYSLDLFPSLPTPAELEAIYEWDRRLLIETLEEASITETVTATLQ